MRGEDQRSEGFFSYVRFEQRIAADHPLRAIRELVEAALKELSRVKYARSSENDTAAGRLVRLRPASSNIAKSAFKIRFFSSPLASIVLSTAHSAPNPTW
jgi:hypothetical protein